MTRVEPTRSALAQLPRTRAEQCALGFLIRFRNPNTRRGYQRSIKQWFEFCETNELEPLDAKRVHLDLWARTLEALGNKPSTVASKFNALAGFYKFAVIDEFIDKNPMDHVNRPQIPRESSTNGVTGGELAAIVRGTVDEPRLHALVCLLGFNGLRISEVLGIDISDLGLKDGFYTVTVLRKGGKRQTVPLSAPTMHAIDVYRSHRRTGPLFITSTGARLTRNQVGKEISRLARDLGITKRISPHSFRHGFVTTALDAQVPIRDVQNSTGHSDSRMVTYYDRNRDSLAHNATHAVTARVMGMV